MTSRKGEKVVLENVLEDIRMDTPLLHTPMKDNKHINDNDDDHHHHNHHRDDDVVDDVDDEKKQIASESSSSSRSCPMDGKKIVGIIFFGTITLLLWDALMRSPEERFLKPDAAKEFLEWVESNPYWGLGAFLLVIAVCVVLLIPVGTPLTLGCGYIYKGVYGWTAGVAVATAVSMAGSALGAVCCFLLGRYMMRDRVRKWVRKYPLFDAIDMAVSEHGLRIMAMLYLTPVLPLGPVSYMCGSTSMALSSFVLAKVASLPLMLLYVYIGAAAGTLIADADAIEHNSTLIIGGIVLSAVMISCISHYIRRELMSILEKQKSVGKKQDGDIEVGGTVQTVPRIGEAALQRRHVAQQQMDDSESDINPQKGK